MSATEALQDESSTANYVPFVTTVRKWPQNANEIASIFKTEFFNRIGQQQSFNILALEVLLSANSGSSRIRLRHTIREINDFCFRLTPHARSQLETRNFLHSKSHLESSDAGQFQAVHTIVIVMPASMNAYST